MDNNNPFFDGEFARAHYDDDSLGIMEEMPPYELIHSLLADIRRLENLVIATRNEVNCLSSGALAYDLTAEDLSCGSYYDFPAMKRYVELYGESALIPWE